MKKNKSGLILTENTQKQIDNDMSMRENQAVIDYNKNIYNKEIDPRFSEESIGLLNGMVMVRLLKEPYLKNGLVNVVTFAVPTPSGTKTEQRQDPLPYQNQGIIVNMDPALKDRVSYNVGDFVQITEEIVYTRLTEDGPKIRYMFMRVDDRDFEGYVMIPAREIMCILKDIKDDQ